MISTETTYLLSAFVVYHQLIIHSLACYLPHINILQTKMQIFHTLQTSYKLTIIRFFDKFHP